ncbi:oxidoreductase HTATIP2-like isoform X2 [Homarus americanus]|uniref:Protein HTATIP2 n=2 Tax=Homarus americanus TaxID=6706 RepID=A0A8J5N3V3_HOMAM|nr:oxidoreductase HTATIP2-like isoform X2 [Homarus americanus]KAG7172707.1 Oxidoreductase HTATIP2-like [Homarus americanus]
MSEGMTALVLGGSGEIGKQLVRELVANAAFSRIVLVTRRQLDIQSEKVEQKIVDFEKLDDYKEAFGGAQVGFCCLGTTRGKAGAKGFIHVDRDYVSHAARLLKEGGCSHFHLVSSTGANKTSMFLYNKTKGEAEELVKELNFPRLSIYRPSLLLCDREESRPLEKVAQIVVRGFDWRNKISIGTDTVASAMISNTLEPQSPTKSEEPKVEILENTDILRLGID